MTTNSQSPLLVRLDRVDVVLAGAPVLRDISWQLRCGEQWGIVGANGSGKTSFLRLISGALWPAPGQGTRRYDFGAGARSDAVQARREVALVGHELQDLYTRWGWNFTALDVVLSGLYGTDVPRRHARPEERVRAGAVLRQLALPHLAARPFLELSRGEQRRVLIARSVALRPAILLLDEPASGLDGAARAALDDLIEDVSARTSIVCSAHAIEDLPPVVTRVLRVEQGRIFEDGAAPPRAVRAAMSSRANGGGAELQPAQREDSGEDAPASPTTHPTRRRATSRPLVEITRADVWLGRRRVLSRISWQLDSGEHWLVTGANGAGKSSFLKLLHGQLRPGRGGGIRWPDLGNPRNVWKLRRQVAWVSPELQAAYRFPSTVRECVASGFESSVGLTRRLTPEEEQRVDTLLERFQLASLAQRHIATLSYGQLRRALIVRALVNGPRVLLLDEPWEGLDGSSIALLHEHLREIVGQGAQLVCASHWPGTDSGSAARLRQPFTHELTLEGGYAAKARALPSGVLMDAPHALKIAPMRDPEQ